MAKKPARERLKAWRQRHKLTQAEAGGWFGCSQQMVQAIEAGRRLPGRETAATIEFYASIKTGDWS